jgi:hypothetical protein
MRSEPFTRDRQSLIAEMHDRLLQTTMPRFVMLVIVSIGGLIGFLTAVVSLRLGLTSMGTRYFVATLAGYLAFVGLVRFWIALRRSRSNAVADALDGADLSSEAAYQLGDAAVDSAVESIRSVRHVTGGGRSGGGGSAGSWTDAPAPVEGVRLSGRGGLGSASFDLDEGWWLVIAGIVLLGGFAAVASVVWSAPMLLAEVALDAALVSTVYRKLRKQDAGHWLGALWRRTWLPAVMLVGFMTILGIALQQIAPDAVSIGGVFSAR